MLTVECEIFKAPGELLKRWDATVNDKNHARNLARKLLCEHPDAYALSVGEVNGTWSFDLVLDPNTGEKRIEGGGK